MKEILNCLIDHCAPLIGGSSSLFFLPIYSNSLIDFDRSTPLD